MVISMDIKKNSLIKIGLCIGLFLCLNVSIGQAQETMPAFNTFQQAQAEVVWIVSSGSDEITSQGTFYVTLPDKFIYVLADADARYSEVSGYKNILGFQLTHGQVEYNYHPLSLFRVYENVFGRLLAIPKQPAIRLGEETLIGRRVQLYQGFDHSNYWFDLETNLPLRITNSSGELELNIRQYKVDSSNGVGINSVHLRVYQRQTEGLIVLENINGYWLPQQISLDEGDYTVTITFSNWQVLEEAFQLPKLETLASYLELAEQAYLAGDLKGIIENYKQVLRVDPFNIYAYAKLAYAYGELGNYLGAVESYQQWLMLDPQNPTALNNLAYTYLLAGNHIEDAIAMAHQAYQLEPGPHKLDTIGYGYYLNNEYDKALHYLEQASNELSGEALILCLEHLLLVYEAIADETAVEQVRQQIELLKMEMDDERPLF